VPDDGPMLHEHLAPLAGLVGTWQGEGHGDYPTIQAFTYGESLTVGHVGKPFLTVRQRTWAPSTGAPMHAEDGYLRLAAPGGTGDRQPRAAELVIAHPMGIVEVEEGLLEDGVLRLTSTHVGRTSTAKDVRSLRRELRLDGDRLAYDLWMAYADVPETHHLRADLHRIA
jgi:hypothetical protein